MKKLILLSVLFIVFSCKKENQESFGKPSTPVAETPMAIGKTIFEGKGMCITCHKPDIKLVGPSLQDIAKIYKEKNGNMISFLKGEGEALVDPSQYEVMKANFAVTKTFSDEELKSVELYVNSFLK
jgi:cytochrome c